MKSTMNLLTVSLFLMVGMTACYSTAYVAATPVTVATPMPTHRVVTTVQTTTSYPVNRPIAQNSDITITANSDEISANLDLRAIANIFAECKTLEEFERNINDYNTQLSNLDLNKDGYVDYIRVLEKAEGLLESGNLTETERKTVTAQKENCKNLLEIIEEVEGEITSLEDSVSRLDIDTVNSENEDTVNDLLERVNNLLKGDNLTDEEAAAMQAVQEKAGKLREKLEEAAMAGATENIEKVENIDWGNVTEKNKDDLTAAREDLENALKNYSGNYTEEEKNTLEEKLERVNGALDSIAKAETVEGAIAELPDTVKPDDTDAEKLISQAKKQYDALTEHEKNLVSGEAKEKLKRLLKEIADYQIIKGDGSKWTMGDKDPVTMVANGAYSKFTGIQVDGKDVETSYYTAKSGSTVISLKPEYLSTLSLGQHTLTVLYTDGQTSGQFEIIADSKDNSPKTGDKNNTLLWTFLMIAAACGAAGMTYRCYNRKCSK